MTEITHFLRGNKRYAPPFRVVYNRRKGGAPLIIKDARNTRIGSFSKWPYAFACLQALHHQAGLPPPINDVARHAFEQDIWYQIRQHPHSKALFHINAGIIPRRPNITKHSRDFANRD